MGKTRFELGECFLAPWQTAARYNDMVLGRRASDGRAALIADATVPS